VAWRINSTADAHRWAAWGDNGLEADDITREELEELVDGETAVALTLTGPYRDVSSLDDEVGVFLLAMQGSIPYPHEIIGTPPTEDTEAAEIPEGAVA
jgi:hypothetical protein